ncbi:MAG: ATP-binding cassette domain-containing protein, partial [Polyangiales bacterium]
RDLRAALGALGLSDLEVDKPIRFLSGGEKARVALAKLMVQQVNCLLLDEPTNHLDLGACESLAKALQGFAGTLLFVSHNLAFIRALATHIWTVEEGQIVEYPGGLDDFLSRYSDAEAQTNSAAATANSQGGGPAGAQEGSRRQSKKERRQANANAQQGRQARGKLERELGQVEARIAEVEAAQRAQSEQLCDPAVYADPAQREPALEASQALQSELETLMERWSSLQEGLEACTKAQTPT